MKKIFYVVLLLSCGYIQCAKTKLSPLPDYKSPEGTKLDSTYLIIAGVTYDSSNTYILDDRYGDHVFFRINEATGKMENVPHFNGLQSFAVSSQYIYTSRTNQYPGAFHSLYRVNKANYNDSVLINARMIYYYLTYADGSLFGLDQLGDLCKVDPATGNGTEILTTADFRISQVSFISYMNSSKFYNGWWLFLNENGSYLLKVKTDGSKQTDTIQSVKTPIFAVHNNRIYFSLSNPGFISNYNGAAYKSCLASVDFDGGAVTIEDTTNLRQCNTVSNYGNLLLIGDGRFIKTFDPVSKQVTMLGAMTVFANETGSTTPSYPFFNANTGSVYYSAYNDRFPVHKLK